jgi:hypothetical protein
MVYFQTKNIQIWVNFRVSDNEDVGNFFNPLVYFTAISYILWPFLYFVVIMVRFSRFGMLYQEKSGNPAIRQRSQRLLLWGHAPCKKMPAVKVNNVMDDTLDKRAGEKNLG